MQRPIQRQRIKEVYFASQCETFYLQSAQNKWILYPEKKHYEPMTRIS